MEICSKLQIYKGIINYILETTHYTLKNIADLSSTSLKNIVSIYSENTLPSNFKSEIQLLKLYQMILEITSNEQFEKYLPLPKCYSNLGANN